MVTIAIKNDTADGFESFILSYVPKTNYIKIIRGQIYNVDRFNSGNNLMGLYVSAFNGGGSTGYGKLFSASNIKDYIFKMWRLKR